MFLQQNMPMWQLGTRACRASVRRQVQPDGVDLIYTFTNPTDEALPIGELVVGTPQHGLGDRRFAGPQPQQLEPNTPPQYGAPGGYYRVTRTRPCGSCKRPARDRHQPALPPPRDKHRHPDRAVHLDPDTPQPHILTGLPSV